MSKRRVSWHAPQHPQGYLAFRAADPALHADFHTRISEAKKLGFTDIVLPKSNLGRLSDQERDGVNLHPAETLETALDILFS